MKRVPERRDAAIADDAPVLCDECQVDGAPALDHQAIGQQQELWFAHGFAPGAPFFHPDIGMAMRDRPGGPPGLHNFAAYTGGRVPPELEGLPMTTSYNIDLPRCTEEQKEQFYAVLGRNPGHPMHIPSQYE